MRLVIVAFAALAGLALASLLALYAYGRFAEKASGEPSFVLPVTADKTVLDRFVAPLLTDHPNESGLMLVSDNLEAFALRALAARHAGRSLDLQYYIWDDDLTGRLLIGELIRAADRGVRVRFLVDDINARGFDRTYLAMSAHPNIEVRLFNPSRNRAGTIMRAVEMLLRAVQVNRRMHNKAWIADGRIALIGGRNIGDAYFDAAEQSNFRDLDLALFGPAVQQTEAIFDRFWNSRAAIPMDALGELEEEDLPRLRLLLDEWEASGAARPYLDRVVQSESVQQIVSGNGAIHWTEKATVVSDPPEKAGGERRENWLMNAILPVLTSGKASLEIASPYFIPGEAGTRELVGQAARGVEVSVLTNSLAATDVAAVHGAYAHYREPLVRGGVQLFELRPYRGSENLSLFGSSAASLHTKAFTVDGRAGFVGSMNFDPRSISLNTEMGALFEQADLVQEIRAVFAQETSPEDSYRVIIDNGELAWQDGPAGNARLLRSEPEAGFWRRLLATVIGWLPVESQL